MVSSLKLLKLQESSPNYGCRATHPCADVPTMSSCCACAFVYKRRSDAVLSIKRNTKAETGGLPAHLTDLPERYIKREESHEKEGILRISMTVPSSHSTHVMYYKEAGFDGGTKI